MCEEKHKKTRGTVIWVRERQDRKRWWQHSRKEKVGQNKKKKGWKGGNTREEEPEDKNHLFWQRHEMRGKRRRIWEWNRLTENDPKATEQEKKNSSEVSANQTDSMTGRWKELNDVRMRAKRNRRWQKDGRGGHRVERVRKEGKWLAGKKTDGGGKRERQMRGCYTSQRSVRQI